MSELASSKEERILAALRELATRARDSTTSLSDAVDVCAWTLAVIGVGSDRGAFLQQCLAAGLGTRFSQWLWQELGVRRSGREPWAH